MFDGIAEAMAIITSPAGVLIWVVGAALGCAFGLVPGISGTQAMAILLPFTFVMDQSHAMLFLVAIMAAGGFSGSITSILLNVPGEPTNAATTLDGYPLSRQGKAGVAIAASATASALGALIGLLLLVLSIPVLRELVLYFGPPELFAFAIAGIALIGSASGGSQLKGLIAGACGMLIGAIGYNNITGEVRYTGGMLDLWDGIPLIAAVVGLFSIPELYRLMRSAESVSSTGVLVAGGVRTGIREVLRRPALVGRSSLIGTGIGLVPGVGGAIASWVAYFAAKRTSRSPETFGKGNIEGVIAPDATLNAKEGGAMMPVLALGLPGDLSTAILLSAFLLHGVTPGQRMFDQHMDLVWLMILAMVLVNLVTSGVGLVIANQLIKITLVPARTLVPVMLVLVLLGSYVERQAFSSILIAVTFGLLGIAMTYLGYPRAPLLVGIILFPIAEDNFHISLQISWGSYDFLLRPITVTVLIIVGVALVAPWLWRRVVRPRMRASARTATPLGSAGASTAGAGGGDEPDAAHDTVGLFAVLITAVALFAVSFGYSDEARFFPLIVLTVLIALTLWATSLCLRRLALRQRARSAERVLVPSTPENRSSDGPGPPPPQRSGTSMPASLAWLLALPALIWLAGAAAAIFVYTTAFMLGYQRQRPQPANVATSLVIAAIMTGVALYGFQHMLGIHLPEGALVPSFLQVTIGGPS